MRIQHYHHQTMVQTVAKTTLKTHQATRALALRGLALKTKKEKKRGQIELFLLLLFLFFSGPFWLPRLFWKDKAQQVHHSGYVFSTKVRLHMTIVCIDNIIDAAVPLTDYIEFCELSQGMIARHHFLLWTNPKCLTLKSKMFNFLRIFFEQELANMGRWQPQLYPFVIMLVKMIWTSSDVHQKYWI